MMIGTNSVKKKFGRSGAMAVVGVLLSALSVAQAQNYLFDFGAAGTPTTDTANAWNNVAAVGWTENGQLTNVVSVDNTPSGINLVIVRTFNGANENGTTTSPLYPANATRDSLYGNTESWNERTDVFPSFKFTGLDPATSYGFTFYASRTGVGDNRETEYTVAGATTEVAYLDAANNIESTVSTPTLKPTAEGEITISMAPGPNNNNGYHFTYLGVLLMQAIPTQTPIAFTQQPISQRIVVYQPVTFSAAVTGSPPYTIQWYMNGNPIQDATRLTYTIPSATPDLDGAAYAVSVSNLVYGATSTNAILNINTDTNPPTLISATSASGLSALLTFSESLEPFGAAEPSYYVVNGQPTASAQLLADGKTVFIVFAAPVENNFTVAVSTVTDLAGNPIEPGATASGTIPAPEAESYLIDFGGGNSTQHGPAPDDLARFWNNVSATLGGTVDGELSNLVTSRNRATDVRLVIVSRFNGANENGTQSASAPFPTDATRDSLFGNTEAFSGLSDIFPVFKLAGLDTAATYRFEFFASRTGVSDNRETGYTVTGANNGYAALNAANNITNIAVVTGITPDTSGEITISLAPTQNNNNANHFTYLGVLKVATVVEAPEFLPVQVIDNQLRLEWTGNAQLEAAPNANGPWNAITPSPTSPYLETIQSNQNRFFRLRKL